MFGTCLKRDTPYPRDGCYAWFVAFCCFCGMGVVFGTINMFSLLLPVWIDEFNFGRGATGIAIRNYLTIFIIDRLID